MGIQLGGSPVSDTALTAIDVDVKEIVSNLGDTSDANTAQTVIGLLKALTVATNPDTELIEWEIAATQGVNTEGDRIRETLINGVTSAWVNLSTSTILTGANIPPYSNLNKITSTSIGITEAQVRSAIEASANIDGIEVPLSSINIHTSRIRTALGTANDPATALTIVGFLKTLIESAEKPSYGIPLEINHNFGTANPETFTLLTASTTDREILAFDWSTNRNCVIRILFGTTGVSRLRNVRAYEKTFTENAFVLPAGESLIVEKSGTSNTVSFAGMIITREIA